MKKTTFLKKLQFECSGMGKLYTTILDDITNYVENIDTETVDNTILHDFIEYHLENGTYQLQSHAEAMEFVRDFLPDILDVFCRASRNTFVKYMLIPLDARSSWWSYEEIALRAVQIIVAKLHDEIFDNNNPIKLPYGWGCY